jgi:SAM-dependent methyltransferase
MIVSFSTTSTAMGSSSSAESPSRAGSYEQHSAHTPVDRFGVWLSARAINRHVPSFTDRSVGDFGCGYQARFVRSVLPEIERAVLVDVALAPDLKVDERITAVEGVLPDALRNLDDASLDVVLCISVLEHLWEPLETLTELRRIVAPGGVCLVNVPTWRGKRFLELSAFRFKLSPAEEMDDHKAYYDPSDLWPLLVRAGFLPHNIRCGRHKFGLNTFAACRVDS